jgi:hypothetical protein
MMSGWAVGNMGCSSGWVRGSLPVLAMMRL